MANKYEMFLCWVATVVVFISTGVITFVALCVIDFLFYPIHWYGSPFGVILAALFFASFINISIRNNIKNREH